MNNKTVIEFGFRIICRIMEISEGVMPIKPLSISTVLEMIQKPNSIIVVMHSVKTEESSCL